MSKRTVFTTLTPLPEGISRETVLETLHNHVEMIDLNPLVQERHPIKPPSTASAEEYHCSWYSLTDRVQYLPGGLATGKVSYNVCFHDLPMGVQTHCFAPMRLQIKGKWTLGGSLPGEPLAPVELGLGAPLQGLWLREDVDMKCNIMMTSFVKRTLKKAHSALVSRLVVKASIVDSALKNRTLQAESITSEGSFSPSHASRNFSIGNGYDSGYTGDAASSYDYQQSPPLPSLPNETSLYPEALSIGNRPRSSYTESMNESQHSSSLLDSGNSGVRISWRDSGHSRNRSAHRAEEFQHSAQPFHAELSGDERATGWRKAPKPSEQGYDLPRFGAVELEG